MKVQRKHSNKTTAAGVDGKKEGGGGLGFGFDWMKNKFGNLQTRKAGYKRINEFHH